MKDQSSGFVFRVCLIHVLTSTELYIFQLLIYKYSQTHAVTSIKQSPVLKGYIFLVLS
jgi:hypothetical protein